MTKEMNEKRKENDDIGYSVIARKSRRVRRKGYTYDESDNASLFWCVTTRR